MLKVISPRGNNELEISSEKGVGTKVTISLKFMLKKNEKQVEKINNDIIKEEEYKMAQAIMNKQMLVIYKSSVGSNAEAKARGDSNLSEVDNLACLGVPKKDGWGWEGQTYGQHSAMKDQRRSSGTHSQGQGIGNSLRPFGEFVNLCRMATWDLTRKSK